MINLLVKPALVVGILSGLLLLPLATANAEVTAWQDLGGGRARMVTVYNPSTGMIDGIIDVELLPGWTTYWRSPGEAGIPPDFDFSNSVGIKVEAPQFPLPEVKETSGLISIVYKKHVAFPFKAEALIAPLSGALKLDLLLGVCDEICIPATASFDQDLVKLNGSDPISNAMIAKARTKLPLTNLEDAQLPRILSAKRQSDRTVIIDVQIAEASTKPVLLSEGKSAWFFSPAKLIHQDNSTASFVLSLDDLPKDADLAITALRFTLINGEIGAEQSFMVE